MKILLSDQVMLRHQIWFVQMAPLRVTMMTYLRVQCHGTEIGSFKGMLDGNVESKLEGASLG